MGLFFSFFFFVVSHAAPVPNLTDINERLKKNDMSGQWALRHPFLTGDSKKEVKILVSKKPIEIAIENHTRLSQEITNWEKISKELGKKFPQFISVEKVGNRGRFSIVFYKPEKMIKTVTVVKVNQNGLPFEATVNMEVDGIEGKPYLIKTVEDLSIYFENRTMEKFLPEELSLRKLSD